MPGVRNTCDCPNPPGGRVECEPNQAAVCVVENGVAIHECHNPPDTSDREIVNWAVGLVTGQASSSRVLRSSSLKMLLTGVFEREDGALVTFSFPPRVNDAITKVRREVNEKVVSIAPYLPTILAEILPDEADETQGVPRRVQTRDFAVVAAGLSAGIIVGLFGHNTLAPLFLQSAGPTNASWKIDSLALLFLHVLQLCVISVILYRQARRFRRLQAKMAENRMAGPVAVGTMGQFRDSWLLMWKTWIILYSWLSLSSLYLWTSPVTAGKQFSAVETMSDLFNLLSGFAIWRCFFVLTLPSVSIPGKLDNRDKPFRRATRGAGLAGIICFLFGAVDRLLVHHHFGLTLIGLYGALALACLTGRLSNRFIAMPQWMLLLLYLYSMVQLAYSFFDLLGPEWQLAVYFVVLVLKVTLAFAGVGLLKYGGLDRYLSAAETGMFTGGEERRKLLGVYRERLESAGVLTRPH